MQPPSLVMCPLPKAHSPNHLVPFALSRCCNVDLIGCGPLLEQSSGTICVIKPDSFRSLEDTFTVLSLLYPYLDLSTACTLAVLFLPELLPSLFGSIPSSLIRRLTVIWRGGSSPKARQPSQALGWELMPPRM